MAICRVSFNRGGVWRGPFDLSKRATPTRGYSKRIHGRKLSILIEAIIIRSRAVDVKDRLTGKRTSTDDFLFSQTKGIIF